MMMTTTNEKVSWICVYEKDPFSFSAIANLHHGSCFVDNNKHVCIKLKLRKCRHLPFSCFFPGLVILVVHKQQCLPFYCKISKLCTFQEVYTSCRYSAVDDDDGQ